MYAYFSQIEAWELVRFHFWSGLGFVAAFGLVWCVGLLFTGLVIGCVDRWRGKAGVLLVVALGVAELRAVEPADPRLSADVPREVREWYRNPDGSCVQCSNGMMGVDQNVPAFSSLLWASEYGPAERGGSGPARVEAYARKRGVKIRSFTGKPAYELLAWAVSNGRGAALTCGASHMQYCMGYDSKKDTWYVCNNNSTHKIDEYNTARLHQLCDLSGPWVVALEAPPHPHRGVYRTWWERRPQVGEQETFLRPAEPLRVQPVQFPYPRELPKLALPAEVDVKEIRRRGDMEQVVGDGLSDNPIMQRVGEVFGLPSNDADRWHIWCLCDAQGSRSKRLLADWQRDRDLRSYAIPGDPANSWAHFAVYNTDDPLQNWRWEKIQVTATPSVFVQPPVSKKFGDPSTIVFQAVYADNPAELASSMRQAIIQYLATLPTPVRPDIAEPGQCPPNGPCPPFKPTPRPVPVVPDRDELRPPSPLLPLVPPPNTLPRPSLIDLIWSSANVFAVLSHLVMLLLAVALSVMTYRYLRYGSVRSPADAGTGAKRKRRRRAP